MQSLSSERRTRKHVWSGVFALVFALGCVDSGGGPSGDSENAGQSGSGSAGTGGNAGGSLGGSPGSAGGAGGSTAPVAGNPDLCAANAAVAAMKLGWNLGNALDSNAANRSDTDAETAWGNPTITADIFKLVAQSGFGVVRIPVTWVGRFGAAPDYPIHDTFISRVEEVVKYALDQNLYVIINIHHDGSNNAAGRWLTLVDASGQVTAANNQKVDAQFKAMWQQIAERFRSYGDHLVFEGMNEVMVDYSTPKAAYTGRINALNQLFVDTVRSTGGNNAGRCLVVPGYNTNVDYTVGAFKTPTDSAAGKLILSAHFYDPWEFAGDAKNQAWGTGNPGITNWGQEDHVRTQVAKLKTNYIDKGLPVIWGEYGAVNQTGYEKYRRYYMEYVTKAAHDAGIVPIFWDNNSGGSGKESFGLLDRSDNTVRYPTILDAMVRAATSSYTLAEVAKP